MTQDVYYFGAWGAPGHYLWSPSGRIVLRVHAQLPWASIDGALAGDPTLRRSLGYWSENNQPEGVARLHHLGGWTALAFWDRSGDHRTGSNSVLFARGLHTAAEMAALFEQHFPAVWQRITSRFQVRL